MIIALAGRRIDSPETSPPRFPLNQTEIVKNRLEALFQEKGATVLVCSGACGADLLALEIAGRLGIRRRLVLPFEQNQFKSLSVVDRPGNWGPVFDHIYEELLSSSDVVTLKYAPNDDEAFTQTNRVIFDEAEAIIKTLAEKTSSALFVKNIKAVLVWEGSPRNEGDTTADFKREAERRGLTIEEISTI